MPELIPYGENGVTNKLLEAFVSDAAVYKDFIAQIRWHQNGLTGKKKKLSNKINLVIEQMGLGRQKGGGEPDGVIAGKDFVILLETKMNGINSLLGKKKGILDNYVKIAQKMLQPGWHPLSYEKNSYLREKVVGGITPKKHLWYLVFITDGNWEDGKTPGIYADIVSQLKGDNKTSENHFGWIGLHTIKEIAQNHNCETLETALRANGKWDGL